MKKTNKTKSKKEKPVLSRKNAQSNSTLQGKNAQSNKVKHNHKYFQKLLHHKMVVDNPLNRPLFYIGLKEKEEGFPVGVYPVYSIENEQVSVGANKTPLEIMLGKRLDGLSEEEKKEILDNAELTLDVDDEEYMDNLKEKEVEPVFQMIVWLFIANSKNGKYAWIDSSKTYYLT